MIWSSNRYDVIIAMRVLVLIVLAITGGCVMGADTELKWEWPANRPLTHKLLINVHSLEKQGGGLFGVKQSPSLVASVPDPFELKGVVIKADKPINAENIALIAPKLEVENIKPGAYAVLGLVNDSTCVCIVPVKNKDVDLTKIECPK